MTARYRAPFTRNTIVDIDAGDPDVFCVEIYDASGDSIGTVKASSSVEAFQVADLFEKAPEMAELLNEVLGAGPEELPAIRNKANVLLSEIDV